MTARRSLSVFALAVVLSSGALLAGQSQPVLHVKGFGQRIGSSTTEFQPSTPVEVLITRFSTDAEREHFVATGIPGLSGMPVIG
jgi:hypothetical protein